MIKHVFLTGQPGVGKTTLVRRVADALLRTDAAAVDGFFTEETRGDDGRRSGFDVVSLRGDRAPLARLGKGTPAVGNYAVDIASFEAVALPALSLPSGNRSPSCVRVIDEVGKMELFSPHFMPTVEAVLTRPGGPLVLGTLPMPRHGRRVEEVERVRERDDLLVLHLTKANRDAAREALQSVLVEFVGLGGAGGSSLDWTAVLPFLQEGQHQKLAQHRGEHE